MVLGYFIFINKSGYGFRFFLLLLYILSYKEPLYARGAAASIIQNKIHPVFLKLKISITSEPTGNIDTGSALVLSYFLG